MLKKIGTAAAVLLIGLAGGAVFYAFHLPLPWTLGSLAAAALLSIHWNTWSMPKEARALALPAVGVLAGSAFTPAILTAAMHWWDAILIVVGFLLAMTALGNAYFRFVGKFDWTTAFFASVPGGSPR